jgi:phage FluMu protein Com
MNIRCAFCQTPYAIGRTEMLAGLQLLEAENLSHYDAHCPRCRRVTQIPRQKLEIAFPNWKEALTEAVSEAAAVRAPEPAPKASLPIEKPGAGKAAAKTDAKTAAKKAPRKRASKK